MIETKLIAKTIVFNITITDYYMNMIEIYTENMKPDQYKIFTKNVIDYTNLNEKLKNNTGTQYTKY